MLISVIMPVFNGEKYLLESIESILNQTYKDFELVVINDGSTDGTRQLLENIDDKRMRVYHLPQNMGSAFALNKALEESKGEWIALQDADDISVSTRLQDQVNFIKQYPDVVAVAGHIKCFTNSTEFSEGDLRSGETTHNSLITRDQIKSKRFWGCPICSGTVLFSRKAAMQVGGYRLKFKIAYDYDLWMRLWQIGEIDILPQIIYHYRINSDSLSHSNWKETVNELQRISTSAIRRLHRKEGLIKPRYVVIGKEESCRNFEENVRKRNLLSIYKYIDPLEHEQIREAKTLFRKNKVNGVIVLYNSKTPSVIEYFQRKGLELNKNLFHLYNT